MPTERRIQRLEQLILEVAAETIQREVRDPRMGMTSITRVQLTRDLSHATVYWSSLGTEKARRRVADAVESALPLVQRRVAQAMHTRVTPALTLTFDPSLERAQRLDEIFQHLREERGEPPEAELGDRTGAEGGDESPPDADEDTDPGDDGDSGDGAGDEPDHDAADAADRADEDREADEEP